MACKYCTTGTSMTIAFEEFEVCFKCIERALDRCFMAQNYLECPGCSSKSWDIINGQCINCGLTSERIWQKFGIATYRNILQLTATRNRRLTGIVPRFLRAKDLRLCKSLVIKGGWLRGLDLNQGPSGYEP